MYVRDLMTPGVVSVKPTDTLAVARQKFLEHSIHHLIVLDGDHVVGVVGYRDLIGRSDAEVISRVMSRDVVTVEPWETVRSAASRMIGRKHGCLPVVESGMVRGVLTTTDLLRAVSHTKSA